MSEKNKQKIHIIFGPTASGKTERSIKLAKELGNAEIINADSMQIYTEIPIITNQPTEEEREDIPHHLFSIKSITEHSDLAQWLELAVNKTKGILDQGKTPILIGGTGMYLKSIVEGVSQIPTIPEGFKSDIRKEIDAIGIETIYKELTISDPHHSLEPGDTQRVTRAYEVLKFTGKPISEWNKTPNRTFFEKDLFDISFIDKDRQEIYNNINQRFLNMVDNGLLQEAEKADQIFKNSELTLNDLARLPAYKAHGLREIIQYINGKISKEEAIERAQQATRNYAKRQFTWWRSWSNKNPKL